MFVPEARAAYSLPLPHRDSSVPPTRCKINFSGASMTDEERKERGEFIESVLCSELACLVLADHNILGLKLPLYL